VLILQAGAGAAHGVLTAVMARRWPMKRWPRRSSMRTSFSRSLSRRLVTGMPVPGADDPGEVFFGDFLFEHRGAAALHLGEFGVVRLEFARGGGDVAVLNFRWPR